MGFFISIKYEDKDMTTYIPLRRKNDKHKLKNDQLRLLTVFGDKDAKDEYERRVKKYSAAAQMNRENMHMV